MANPSAQFALGSKKLESIARLQIQVARRERGREPVVGRAGEGSRMRARGLATKLRRVAGGAGFRSGKLRFALKSAGRDPQDYAECLPALVSPVHILKA